LERGRHSLQAIRYCSGEAAKIFLAPGFNPGRKGWPWRIIVPKEQDEEDNGIGD
jgi:hypothetical protein